MAEESIADRLARAQLTLVRTAVATEHLKTAEQTAQVSTHETDYLTNVPGIVGELVDWIVRSARRPNRMLALATAIGIVGTLIGRRVAGPTKSGTHLYIVALAGTAAGKQHGIDCIKTALDAVAPHTIGPGNFASSQGVVKLLKRSLLSLCAMDEFGSFLRRINNKNAGNYETEITGELRKLWGLNWTRYDSAESARADSQALHSPALSIFGTATPEDFYSSLKSEDIANGFLNRFLILETGPRGPENDPPPGSDKLPAALEARLRKLFQPTPFGVDVFHGGPGGKLEPAVLLRWAPDAKEVYSRLSQLVDNEPDPQTQKLKSRVPEMAVRLATIRAAGRFSETISFEDMEWARDLALVSSDMLCEGVLKHMTVPFEFAEICPEIVRRVRTAGGRMTLRKILRSFEKHVKRGADIKSALRHLCESGQLVSETPKNPKGGRQSVVYRLPVEGMDE